MIQYVLKCAKGHRFESWFQSAVAFDKLAAAGHVTCAICGDANVEKAIMAPRVRPGRKAVSGLGDPEPSVPAVAAETPPPAAPSEEMQQALKDLRKSVEANSDYVGEDFATEARAMHLGEAPERAIYGEAKLEDAKDLIEDGVPVLPLPFTPKRKTN
ncbi:hypothetical protein SAMN04488118_10883 [Epibacterium ulvae]|uniref:DUF1178 family protein n=1 Tax=Epibacterium ulvae TaxID=1156985 RepID=A0A1G5R4E7_9RHOB|nr:DUF1178 family protein [Epibacterium ulvae]SCZ68738.1 hypothetical protein SAMN04488118_10883 [Epibacterium ulvae]